MDQSTVSRVLSLFQATGTVDKKVYPEGNFEPAQLLILNLVASKPDTYILERHPTRTFASAKMHLYHQR